MTPTRTRASDVDARARERVAEVARTLGASLTELAGALHAELAGSIPELNGDPMILELLRASTESNVETWLHFVQHAIPLEDLATPTAALAYARRLAQRETSTNALLRAYRLGQRRVADLAFAEIARQEPDHDVAYAAARLMHELTFSYVDHVAQIVVVEYEVERERWLANWNTLRASMLATILGGEKVDLAAGEGALGYRLRQHHLGVVAWDQGREHSATALRELETLIADIGESVGSVGQPLFIPRDRSLGWAWIPMGRTPGDLDLEAVRALVEGAGPAVRVALGNPAAALPGFRGTHLEAVRAYTVATIAGDNAERVTTYAEPGVRAAALLTNDLPAARELVAEALGGLAAADENAERLRETLMAFLSEGGSFLTTAERIHVHKNTVKYRVDKAVELRGRPLDDERFNLELALLACRWLGPSILPG